MASSDSQSLSESAESIPTPTSAVQHAMNATERILNHRLQDLQRLSKATTMDTTQDDDDASMDRELEDLVAWQDCLQAELLQLDASWSQDSPDMTESDDSDDVESSNDLCEKGELVSEVKRKLVTMEIEASPNSEKRSALCFNLMTLILQLSFQAKRG